MIETKTAAEILALNTAGQREYAKTIGVKRSASDTKSTIAAKLLSRTLEIEKEQAPAAAPAKAPAAPKAPKLCDICNKRRPNSQVRKLDGIAGMCRPCYDEAGWENTHSDGGHAKLAEGDEARHGCWICFPELNEATREARKATTSKAGMVILAKGTYVHKSELVKNAIEKLGGSVKITQAEDLTRLVGKLTVGGADWTIIAEWTGNAFNYAGSSLNGGKFRNVKELFRELGL